MNGFLDLTGQLKRLAGFLGLRHPIVCVKGLDDIPKEREKSRLFACTGIKQAFAGRTVYLHSQNLSCFGARHWLGFDDFQSGLEYVLTQVERLFKDQRVIQKWFQSIPVPPRGRYRCFELSAGLNLTVPPLLYVFRADPHQVHRLHSALAYSRGDLVIPFYYAALCQGSITNPLVTDSPSITIPDNVAREICGFAREEMLFTVPHSFINDLLEGMFDSDGAREKTMPHLKKFFKKFS